MQNLPSPRNQAELTGTVDVRLPRFTRWQIGKLEFLDPIFVATGASKNIVTASVDPNLPFFKIWAIIMPQGVSAGWSWQGDCNLKSHSRTVEKLTMNIADQTQAMALGSEPAISDFVSGTGTPNVDQILFNSQWAIGAVALSAKRVVGVYDQIDFVYRGKLLSTGAYLWARIDQSNVAF